MKYFGDIVYDGDHLHEPVLSIDKPFMSLRQFYLARMIDHIEKLPKR